MIPFIITKEEVKNYFTESLGYETIDDLQILHIYCKEAKDFFYLPSRKFYFRPYIFLTLLLSRNILGMPLRVEWNRFLFHTYLNRTISQQSKIK